MDYFGVSSPTFVFGQDILDRFNGQDNDRKENHEKIKKEFQDSDMFESQYEEIKNNFESNQNFFAGTFSMEKIDSIPNGFGCQSANCNNEEAKFGTTYLPFCNENKKCMQKNIEHLLLENAKLKVLIETPFEYGVTPMELEDETSLKRKREDGLKKSVEPKPKRLFSDSI